jgi:serine/threonine-protein kinase
VNVTPLLLTQPLSWQPGTVVGRYRLVRAVARGGMGEIWLAEAAQGGVPVIIKRLHDMAAQRDGRGEMLLDEARIASQLDHPNIVRLLDLGSGAGVVYLVMEYLHGEPLARVQAEEQARKQSIPTAHAVSIVAQIARALGHAHGCTDVHGHALNLVHRDVTPDNIILTYGGVPKLIDFGIAKATGRSTVTRDGAVKGKLAYMAPEQARSEALDGRADQFSLGVILFELLSGTRFHDPALNDLSLFRVVTEGGPFPRLVDRVPTIDPMLLAAVDRATAPRAQSRFPDATQLATVLDSWLSQLPSKSRPDLGAWLTGLFRTEAQQQVRASAAVAELDAEALDSAAWFANLPALDVDGRLVKPGAVDSVLDAQGDRFSPNDPPLELARPVIRRSDVASVPPPPVPGKASGRGLAIVAMLLLVLAGAFFLVRTRLPGLRLVSSGKPSLVITSEPSGASVRIAGQPTGTTPFAADNAWTGQTHVTITLPGYAPYDTTFTGGAEVQLFARMKQR